MDEFRFKVCEIKDLEVSNNFPELTDLEIRIDLQEDTDELMGFGELTQGGYYVDIDTVMKKASDDSLYGGLAHELAHISMDEQKNPFTRLFTDTIYNLGTKYNKKDEKFSFFGKWLNKNIYSRCSSYVIADERNTDLFVVERGAGNKLLAFLRFHDKNFRKFKKEDGLTVKELKRMLRVK